MSTAGGDSTLHRPKPLRTLVARELTGIPIELYESLRLRAVALSRSSYVHPRARLVRAKGITVADHCQIHAGATVIGHAPEGMGVRLGRFVIVRENAYIDAHGGQVVLDEGVFVGQNVVIYGQGGAYIGANTMVAPGAGIFTAQHRFDLAGVPLKFQPETFRPVTVGKDCWLGANSAVLAGVFIGDGSVVGAGSVVTHDIPARVVAAGAPARILHERGTD